MKQVLILNDKSETHAQTVDCLSHYDFEVNLMSDGEEALSVCADRMPEVIMVDSKMSKMDGLEFLERLASIRRARMSAAPVILFCVDKQDVNTMGTAVWNGAAECLMKPFDADTLDFKLHQTGAV